LDFINDSSWAKDKKGVLEFTVKEEGYYMSQDSTGREYWNVFIDENGELNKKSVKKSDVISYLSNSEELEKKLKSRLFEFNMIKYAEKDTAWDIMYKPIKNEVTFFAENENYYMVSGKFEKISKQYIRNFTSVLNSYISEEKINNMIISKKRDNVEIKFLDEDRKDITMPVTIDNNSKIVAVPLNFVGVINSVESRV
jgi:hypothetical protein